MRKLSLVLAITCVLILAACGGSPTQTEQASAAGTAAPAASQESSSAPSPSSEVREAEGSESAQHASHSPQSAQPSAPRPAASPVRDSSYAPKPTATTHVPPAPPRPEMVELPAGTVIELELANDLSSKTSKEGDVFSAKVIDPISMGGRVVIPEGSTVEGTVTQAVSAKQMSGQAVLSLQFTKLTLPDGEEVGISASLTEKGKKIGKRTAGIVGGSAAGGAVLGRIIGKDTKGAVVGAILGAAAGSGIAASQKGQELKLPMGTGMAVEIDSAVQVPVPRERV